MAKAKKWTDVQKDLLVKGIEKHGIGNFGLISKESLPDWVRYTADTMYYFLLSRYSLVSLPTIFGWSVFDWLDDKTCSCIVDGKGTMRTSSVSTNGTRILGWSTTHGNKVYWCTMMKARWRRNCWPDRPELWWARIGLWTVVDSHREGYEPKTLPF